MTQRYVVFDGMDGSGKGTQIELLKRDFVSSTVFTREPGGTPFAEEIRKVVRDNPFAGTSTPLNNFLLFWAAREELQYNLVAPMLRAGKHVFSDRGDSSTFAFQLYGEKNKRFLSSFILMRNLVFAGREPDLYIIFDLPAEVARERALQDASRMRTRFDIRGIGYYERVRDGFKAFEKFSKYGHVCFVDAAKTQEEVHHSVVAILAAEKIRPKSTSV